MVGPLAQTPAGMFAVAHAAAHTRHRQPPSSRLVGQELLNEIPAIANGTFTRKIVWSRTPDAWLAEIWDNDGNLIATEIAFSAEDTFLLLDNHVVPPDVAA
jgi:hypothetical protein